MKLWIAAHMLLSLLLFVWIIWGIAYTAMHYWTKD